MTIDFIGAGELTREQIIEEATSGATNSQRVAAAADAVSKALWKLVP